MSKNLEPNCPLCFETLTIKNAVNPSCGHTHCSICFWKWARKSNACPFCRKDLIGRERQKELELANLLERRHEIREHLEELYNEGQTRELDLRILQDDITMEEFHLKMTKEMIKENFEILKKVEKWEARINLWECCPDKAIELWKVEAKDMKKNWRVTQMKKLRVCLDELDIIVCLNDQPYKYENRIYTHKCHIPCLKQLINRVHHLVRAEKIRQPISEPIKEDFNLDTLFLEPEDLEETEQPAANPAIGQHLQFYWTEDDEWYDGEIIDYRHSDGRFFIRYDDGEENWENLNRMPYRNIAPPVLASRPAPDLESIILERLEQFQNRPIHIIVGPSSAIAPRSAGAGAEAAAPEAAAPFHYTTVWTMTDIFEEHRNNILHPPIPRTN